MKMKSKRILSVVLSLSAIAMSLSACGGGAPTTASESTAAPITSEEIKPSAEVAAEIPAVDRSRQLVIYTNSGDAGRDIWLEETANAAGFHVTVMHLGGSELTERLIAEKNNQIADVIFGLNSMNFERIKEKDILIPYTPSWVNEIDPALGDAEGYFYPIVVQALLTTYNTDVYSADTAPADITDLQLGTAWENKHHILTLTGGTCQAVLASILVRYQDENGQYGISDEGWAVVESYIKSGQIENEDWWGDMVEERVPITMLWSSGLLQRMDEYGVTNVSYISPAEGVPFVVEQVGICKKETNRELAKEFVDWFGSSETQSAWAERFGTYPANVNAQHVASQEAQELMNNVRQQSIDWGFVAQNIEYWMEKIQLEFI